MAMEPSGKKTILIDNLTDMFVTLGRVKGQKFLKIANEFVTEKDATAKFILYPEGLDSQVMNWIRSLYGNILTVSTRGFRPLKKEA